MERRLFLGAIALTTLGGVGLRPLRASGSESPDWQSKAVQTEGRPPRFRPPVVTGVSLNATESQVGVVGDDHFVSIYDVQSETFTQHLAGHSDWVRVARFTPDGRQLITAGNDRRALAWDTSNWGVPTEIADQTSAIIDCAISPDSRQACFVGFDERMRVYDLRDRRLVAQWACPCPDMHAVAISADGKWVAAGGRSGVIRVWNFQTGKAVHDLAIHRQRIRALQFTQDDQIISCSEDQFVKVSDAESGQMKAELPRFGAKLFAVTLIDDQTLATSGSDNQITIWDLATQSRQDILTGHTGTVSCLHAGSKLLVSGSYDTQIRIWQKGVETKVSNRQEPNNDGWNLRLK